MTRSTTFATDVARGLQGRPKQIPSHYLYDALGSSLFDAICRLPWYRITRAEGALLARHAGEIAAHILNPGASQASIVELGVGSGEKLAVIIGALPAGAATNVHLIDISSAALDATAARLSGLPHVSIRRYQGTYEEGLIQALRPDPDRGRQLVLFLGSNIGNFEESAARALLTAVRGGMRPGDLLLLGADLEKPAADLMLAYDDPLGVSAAFNRNLLVRINRELGGTFDLSGFSHRATWNEGAGRVEMHLVSQVRQEVEIAAAGVRIPFAAGEAIWTESSYKYTEQAIVDLGHAAGLAAARQWIDGDARFALTLMAAA